MAMSHWDWPVAGSYEPPRTVRIPGWEWDTEVRVWLPPSYHHTDQAYPTLWLTDNMLEPAVAAMLGWVHAETPELILVGVGSPHATTMGEFSARRTFEFTPADPSLILPVRDHPTYKLPPGGAERFSAYLAGDLRAELAATYRMVPHDHALGGHSLGAMFALHTFFTRPGAFAKYAVGSPGSILDYAGLEEAYAARHRDQAVRLFLAAGDAEAADPFTAAGGMVATTALVAELLTRRGYPALDLAIRIFPGRRHMSALGALYLDGIPWLWREQVGQLTAEQLRAMMAGLTASA
jgi:predicted alpha/beta superfamily hydrolase